MVWTMARCRCDQSANYSLRDLCLYSTVSLHSYIMRNTIVSRLFQYASKCGVQRITVRVVHQLCIMLLYRSIAQVQQETGKRE